jgi:hypothetical protein
LQVAALVVLEHEVARQGIELIELVVAVVLVVLCITPTH